MSPHSQYGTIPTDPRHRKPRRTGPGRSGGIWEAPGEGEAVKPPPSRKDRSLLRFLAGVFALTTAVLASVVGIFLAFPYQDDFVAATIDKQAHLRALEGKRLVFVGGSNLAFGLDTTAIDHAFDYHAYNMAVTAHLGLRFLIEQVRHELRKGDVVVLSLEHPLLLTGGDSDPMAGEDATVLMAVRAWPEAWRFIPDFKQRVNVLQALPQVAQRKTLRLIGTPLHNQLVDDREDDVTRDAYTRHAFDSHGDDIVHLHLDHPIPITPGWDLPGAVVDPISIKYLRSFREEMDRRGVRVLFAPPPTMSDYVRDEGKSLRLVVAPLQEIFSNDMLGTFDRYVLPKEYFFDFVYHLNAEGRALRTRRLIEDLHRALDRNPSLPAAQSR